jgi:hypothetical protein
MPAKRALPACNILRGVVISYYFHDSLTDFGCMMTPNLSKCLLLPLISMTFFAEGQVNVLTQHNDLNRTGWNNQETVLNVKNVNRQQFGRVFSRTVDDQIWGQPLIVSGLSIGGGIHNVVFVTTVNNSVYAFDADSTLEATPYWQVNLTAPGLRPVLFSDMTGACGGSYNNFLGHIGIVGTPVIDSITKTIFLVARSVSNTGAGYVQYLHALDIRTGLEQANSPALITASVPGTGDATSNGMVSFDAQHGNQRPGLLFLNGVVYIGYSSHCDWDPYHGWLMAYDGITLQQKAVYISTPNGSEGGIWMSGMAPAADSSGNIYLAVGNGTADGLVNNPNPVNTGSSVVKLTPNGNQLQISSYFTPSNFGYLNKNDLDVGVLQVMLIPQTHLIVTGDKNGELFLLNRDSMGSYNPASNNIIQRLGLTESSNLHASLGFYTGSSGEWMYTWSENTALTAYPFNRAGSNFNVTGAISGPMGPYGQNGAFLSVSSNGSDDSTAILWSSHAGSGDAESSTDPGILRAFSAADITRELWNSSQYPGDEPGGYSKFVCPTIANGKVYLATFSNQLVVYGLVNKAIDTCVTDNIALNKYAVSSSEQNNTLNASAAFDGDLLSRWSSQFSDPQFIYVDLGQEYYICQVVLQWETALGKDFSIQVSDDALNWTTVQSISGNDLQVNLIQMNAKGRYVRMYGTARGTVYGYSLYEFEVFGRPVIKAPLQVSPIVFPNPVQNVVHILKGTDDIQEVEIVDVSGRHIAHAFNSTNSAQVDISLSGLAKAIYFVKVRTTTSSFQFKITHVN